MLETLAIDPVTLGLAGLCGVLIGFTLGLIGGGGSILATPLLLYVVGVAGPHVAIGTGALAVAANAAAGLAAHARAGTVKWPCALVFAVAGMAGALAGSSLGKAVDGQALIAAFGAAMVAVGLWMLRPARLPDDPHVRLTRASASVLLPRLVPLGLAAGAAAGFFGIGGGFLIAPALMAATAMPLHMAVGTSLVAVLVFGAATAANYAASGLVDWPVALALIAGGAVGSALGQRASAALAARRDALRRLFAGLVILVGLGIAAANLA